MFLFSDSEAGGLVAFWAGSRFGSRGDESGSMTLSSHPVMMLCCSEGDSESGLGWPFREL